MTFTAPSIEQAASVDRRWVEKVFIKYVEAEERVLLMRKLIKQGLGVAEVELFFAELADTHRNTKYRSRRKSKLIMSTMKEKLRDSIEERIVWKRRKAETIKRVHQIWGSRATKTKSLFSEIVQTSRRRRIELRTKFNLKVNHVKRKFKQESSNSTLPEELARYRTVRCLQPDFVPPELEANTQPLTFGGVHLDSDESEAMLLDPKFAILDNIKAEGFELEVHASLAKLRWHKMKEDGQEEGITEAEKEELETLEAEARQIYDPKTKTVDYRRYRATDAPMNATLKLPQAQSLEYEAGLEIRQQKWMGVARQFISEFCDDKGRQKDNLTAAQRRGLKKLQKRVADGEIVIIPTDKSGRMVAMTLEDYEKAGEVHTSKDREVTMEQAEEVAKKLRGHTSSWLKILNVGEGHKHENRHRKTFIVNSVNIAELYLLWKDHKSTPASRPVASANNGFNVQFSNLISPLLEFVADNMKRNFEVKSTENSLYKIDQFNQNNSDPINTEFPFTEPVNISCESQTLEGGSDKQFTFAAPDVIGEEQETKEDGYSTDENEFLIGDEKEEYEREEDKRVTETGEFTEKELVFIGGDVCALYPSSTAGLAGKAVREAILQSEVSFEGIDFKELAKYIAINASEYEVAQSGLRRVVPVRAKRRGAKPGMKGAGVLGPHKNKNDEMWKFPKYEPTAEDRRKLLAKGVEIAVKVMYTTHLYTFAGKVYKQRSGAPIGLRGSGASLRVIMNLWDTKVLELMENIKLVPRVAFRYVDDIRKLLNAIKLGWRWTDGVMEYKKAWEEEERNENLTPIKKTARELKKMYESVHKELKFEMETCEDFESRTLPTLDYQCWMEEGKLLYRFYMKKMAKKTLIMKSSALGENTKVAALTQDVVRLSKNTSELVDMETRSEIIDSFHDRLQLSGYSHEQSVRIISNGLMGYERIRRNAARDGGNINRSEEEGREERHKKKLLGKTNWFRVTKTKQSDNTAKGGDHKRRRSRHQQEKTETQLPVVSVMFVPKTGGSILQKRLMDLEPGLSAISGHRIRYVERSGVTLKQLLHRNNPWAGAPCHRATSCLSCASDKEKKDNCSKRSIVYEIHCSVCREEAKAKRNRGEEGLDYIYVGQSSESCFVRGLSHQADLKAGLQGKSDTSHMASHIMMAHGGRENEAKFVMKKVKSYPSTFLRILAECIRIKYRADEEGIVVMNQKSGDFGSYSLPRLSVNGIDQGREPQAQAQRKLAIDERRESGVVDFSTSNARTKGKVKFKLK